MLAAPASHLLMRWGHKQTSGSTIKAALLLGCRAIGVELEEERFNQTVTEIKGNC